jgi:hypothetical protein
VSLDQRANVGIKVTGGVGAGAGAGLGLQVHNVYRHVARGPVKGADGRWRRKLKWIVETPNLTVTEGLNDLLTKYFKGSAYTAAWFVGLIDNAGFSALAAGDTAAQIGGANGWAEATAYSETVRQTLTLGSASAGSIDNSASKAVFSINGTVTVKGAFVVTSSTKSGTSGILYGEAAFGSARSLLSGDTLTVTATLTAATA